MNAIVTEHAPRARRLRPMPAWKIAFYRQCRLWHGWLSAFAFLSLIFFSATGILLNHPGWLSAEPVRSEESHARLPRAAIRAALEEKDPVAALARRLEERHPMHGAFASGDIDQDLAFLRYEGVRGNTSATIDLKSGDADIVRQKATVLTILNDLHRGKNAGTAWKWVIDLSAGLFLVLSLAGYVLFFSMRHRLPQTLALTAGSIGLLVLLFALSVP